MFSSSKILFANYVNRELPPPVLLTTTTTPSPVPLRITAQPQNVTLSAGSTALIGQTTWATGAGYKRTQVRWERSVDGVNWYQEAGYNSNLQSGGFRLIGGADRAQSGLKYRAYAYAYEEFTRFPNYMDQLGLDIGSNTYETLDNLGNQGGRLSLQSQRYYEDFAFIFLKGGQFRINNIQFGGEGSQSGRSGGSNVVDLQSSIGNRSVVGIRNIPSLFDPRTGQFSEQENYKTNIDFTASPGELMKFDIFPPAVGEFPGLYYTFNIVMGPTGQDTPYVGSKIVSEPFTLTVT
jgi:hypothetical protein